MPKFFLFCLMAVLAQRAAATGWTDMPVKDFQARPELDGQIDAAHFDRELMATAIFHETNRVRQELGLRQFLKLPKLDAAADLEAAVGQVYQPPSHTNPFPSIGTAAARTRFVGLDPWRVAENIALISIYDVEPDVGVGVMVREGRRHFVHPRTLAELRPATYRGFATAVVKAWMASPGHRANLVDPSHLYLGCSAQPTVDMAGVDGLFCVQVFFTPTDQKPAGSRGRR